MHTDVGLCRLHWEGSIEFVTGKLMHSVDGLKNAHRRLILTLE